MEYNLTASIVLYKPKPDVFKTVESFLSVKSLKIFLYLIDNSPTNVFEESNESLLKNENVKYFYW